MRDLIAQTSALEKRLFPNELLFSLYCRQRRYWGLLDESRLPFLPPKTNQIAMLQSFFCSHIIDHQDNNFPLSNSLAHTVLPYFAPFQSPPNIRCLIYFLGTSNYNNIAYWVKVVTDNSHQHLSLKACKDCITEDVFDYGTGYWHLSHQYPLATYCYKHFKPLFVCNCANGNRPPKWPLPNDFKLRNHLLHDQHSDASHLNMQLTNAAIQLAKLGFQRYFKPELTAKLYDQQLRRFYGYPKSLQDANHSFSNFYRLFDSKSVRNSLPKTVSDFDKFIRLLKFETSSLLGHPSRHLVIICWLFGSIGNFVEAYDRLESNIER